MNTPNTVEEIIASIVPHLPGWTITKDVHDRTFLAGANGMKLFFNLFGGRITVRGEWPKSAISYPVFATDDDHALNISFAEGRAPERQAKDIKSRFLAKYEPAYAVQVVKRDEYDANETARRKLVQSLGEMLNAFPDEGSQEFHGRCGDGHYVTVRVSSRNSVRLMIDCDATTAAKLVALLPKEA